MAMEAWPLLLTRLSDFTMVARLRAPANPLDNLCPRQVAEEGKKMIASGETLSVAVSLPRTLTEPEAVYRARCRWLAGRLPAQADTSVPTATGSGSLVP